MKINHNFNPQRRCDSIGVNPKMQTVIRWHKAHSSVLDNVTGGGETVQFSIIYKYLAAKQKREINRRKFCRARLYERSKKSGSKITVEESSTDRRLRSKILRSVEESSTVNFDGRSIFDRNLRPQSSLFLGTFIQTGG